MTDKTQPTAAIQTIEVGRPQHVNGGEIDPLAIIEQRNKMLEKVLDYAIRATHPGQWVDQNGKPWPTAAAAEVMARRCAVRVRDVKSKKIASSDDKGPFYLYLVEATASLPGEWDSMEAMGTCSSRDQFLGTETSEGRPLSEIDEGNILKAAYSNMLVNAVTRLLGVRNMTWERLADLGIDKGAAAKVEYRHGSKGGGRSESADDLEVKFGKNKGRKLSELEDGDVRWLVGCWEKDLADPGKSKYHANSKRSIEIARAILSARSAAQAAPDDAGKITPYSKLLALAATKGASKDDVHAWLKGRGKTGHTQVTEDDVAAFAPPVQDDIPF